MTYRRLSPAEQSVIGRIQRRQKLFDAAKTDALRTALRLRYDLGRFAVIEEVADATGAGYGGYCDALVMSLWPSDGLGLDGFELKVSRSDWKRELEQPEKAQRFARYCDTWCLFTYGTAVARLEELPEGWGWWAYTEEAGIEVLRQAPTNPSPQPLGRDGIAALIRRAVEAGPCLGYTAAIAGCIAKVAGREECRHIEQLDKLRERLKALETAVVRLHRGRAPTRSWDPSYEADECLAELAAKEGT